MTDTQVPPKYKPFELSGPTKWLIERYKDWDDTEHVIPYEQLSSVAGVDVTQKRHHLQTARNRLMVDHEKVFQTVAGEGIRLLRPEEVTKHVDLTHTRRLRTEARTAQKKLVCAVSNGLSKEEMARVLARQSAYALIQHVTSKKMRQLETAVEKEGAPRQLNMGDMVEALKGV